MTLAIARNSNKYKFKQYLEITSIVLKYSSTFHIKHPNFPSIVIYRSLPKTIAKDKIKSKLDFLGTYIRLHAPAVDYLKLKKPIRITN